ncbi:MAG: hypothetical protein K940chlam9_01953, partial [Chlamydiae bacterium]|nr:hypothetical protein [Chlamydiota bacterium]
MCEANKSYYLHRLGDSLERYETRQALRKNFSQESGGAWAELSKGKERYFVDKGWLFSSIQKVSREEYLEKLEPKSAKVVGIVLGMLALAPGISELARHVGTQEAAVGLTLHKYPLVGMAALSLFHQVKAQAVGTEFQINTYTTSAQRDPSVATLTDGGFVVTWHSDGQDGDGWGIFGQRYDASGVTMGSEFQINTYTTSGQFLPSVASLADGGFVVAWFSNGQDGDSYGIYGQRYDSSSVKSGVEFQVNTYTTSDQIYPSVAPLNDGGFVVTWHSDGQDGDLDGIYGQRYDNSGVKSGAEFQINTYTTDYQLDSSVAPLNDGGFVVTWHSIGQDGDSYGVYGQRYASSGVKSG